jgi:hypothetical protein
VDRSATVKALPAILDGAVKAGFTFVSLEELLPTETNLGGHRPAAHPRD